MAAFEKAGAPQLVVDMEGIQKARLCAGPYRAVPDDVLEFTMPALLQAVTAAEVRAAQTQAKETPPYICRVSTEGKISLPAVGELVVAGLSLAEIEQKAIEAYRGCVVLCPSIYVRVLEYKTIRVSIAGAVAKPGVYALHSDQLFLAALLTEAGGIIKEGAAGIRIGRLNRTTPRPASSQEPGSAQAAESVGSDEEEVISTVLPVKGFNIPFRDVALQEGDTVVVEQLQIPLFCVLGLVARPGSYPYPPLAEYTVGQALGFAGGLSQMEDPRYVTVYRLAEDGSVVRVALQLIKKDAFTAALNTPIRPGDVVAVERTPRTRMNAVVNNLVRINTGVYVTGNDLWGNRN
jgi:polysaccharide biosynthesis/export protein